MGLYGVSNYLLFPPNKIEWAIPTHGHQGGFHLGFSCKTDRTETNTEPKRYRHEAIDLTGGTPLHSLGVGLPPSPQTLPPAVLEGLGPSNYPVQRGMGRTCPVVSHRGADNFGMQSSLVEQRDLSPCCQ